MVPHCCLNQDAPLCSRGGQQAPTSPLPTSPPPLGLCWTPHVWRSSAPSHPHCPLLQWRPEILAAARAYPCQARRPLVCVCVCVCVCVSPYRCTVAGAKRGRGEFRKATLLPTLAVSEERHPLPRSAMLRRCSRCCEKILRKLQSQIRNLKTNLVISSHVPLQSEPSNLKDQKTDVALSLLLSTPP